MVTKAKGKVKGKKKSTPKKKKVDKNEKVVEDKDKGGRPTKWDDSMKNDIFQCLVVENKTIKETAESCGVSEASIYNWFKDSDGFLEFSTQVREVKAHKLIQRAEEISREIEELTVNNYNAESARVKVNIKKVAFDMKLRLAAKYNRVAYGDKRDVDLTSMGTRLGVAIIDDLPEGNDE